MAFMNRNLSVIACANGFTLWHYKTNDAIAELQDPTYFARVAVLMNTGDIIIINCGDGAHFRQVKTITGEIVELVKMGD